MCRRHPFLCLSALIACVALGFIVQRRWFHGDVVLSEAKQVRIWELEHATFELEHRFGGALKGAWKKRDPAAMAARFRTQFRGEICDTSTYVRRSSDIWIEDRIDVTEPHALKSADTDEFVGWLIAQLADFESVRSVGLRVLSIDRIDDDVQDGLTLWKLKLLLTAQGSAAGGRPLELEVTGRATCRFASDDEIATEPLLESWSTLTMRREQLSQTYFRNVSAAWKLTSLKLPDNWRIETERIGSLMTSGAVADFDADGYPDLVLHEPFGTRILLRNDNGRRFVDVTSQVGLPHADVTKSEQIVQWLDYDNDRDPDLLLGVSLYRNDGGAHFTDVSDEIGIRLRDDLRGAAVADFDGDGWVDLYLLRDNATEQSAPAGFLNDEISGAENILLRNVEGRRFEDVTAVAGVSNGTRRSLAAIWLHANDDIRPDLYVVNDFGINALYINQGNGRFTDIAPVSGVADFANSMGATSGDLNGDGRDEIYVGNMFSKMGRRIIEHVSAEDYPPGVFDQIRGSCAGNRLYQLTADGTRYEDVSEIAGVNQVGWAFAPAMADFDSDGRLDLYATAGFISMSRSKPDG